MARLQNSYRIWLCFGAALAALVLPAPAEAQREIRGTLRDDLGGRGAVAGAEIRLLGTGRSVRTDSAGAFVVDNLTADTVTLAFWAPWLDTLQLAPLQVKVTVTERPANVTLRTPSYNEYHLSRCGFEPRQGEALIIGEVLVADRLPAPTAIAFAQWRALTVEGTTVASELRATLDTVAQDGTFALCGVPTGELVELRMAGSARVGPIVRNVDRPLVIERWAAEDLRGAAAFSYVSGRAIRESGAPLSNAIVELFGDSLSRTRTGADGKFELGPISARSRTLLIRAIGSLELSVDLHPHRDTVALGDLVLRPSAASLNPVLIAAERLEREVAEFEERRRGATGYFITEEMLKGIPQISASTLTALVPRLGASRSPVGNRRLLQLRRGMGFCSPRFFEDGLDLGKLDLIELIPLQFDLIERAKRIEIYSANQAPPGFNDNNGCGAIVIWTR